LDFGLGSKHILKDLSFEIKKGSTFAIVGHNGAGKTTLFHILLGIKFQTKGDLTIFGMPSDSWRARKSIGYVLERPYLNLEHSLKSFLSFHARILGLTDVSGAVLAAASSVGLQDHLEQALSTFSKGMLQKSLLAQAALGGPNILVLDEPMSGLDPASREAEKAQIQKWRGEGKTVIFSSHVMEDVEQLADHVLILSQGVITFFGSVEEWRQTR
jgi:ABC-type multidrug transport system ATPase subunit